MPCPFGTTAYIIYESLGETIALTLTAPLTRKAMMAQVAGRWDSHQLNTDIRSTQNYANWWQGNVWFVIYSAFFQALTTWGSKHALHLLFGTTRNKESSCQREQATTSKRNSLQEVQRARLLAECASLTILYPWNKVITIKTTTATTDAASPTAVEILSGAVSSEGWLLGLYGGLGSSVVSHIQYQMTYRGMLMLWTRNNSTPGRVDEQLQVGSDVSTPKSTGPGHLLNIASPHLRKLAILAIATCVSYPLETTCRRQQVTTTNDNGHASVWAGIEYKILATLVYHSALGLYNSDACSIYFRRVMMKFFH
jgi:hypothetical protein